MLNARGGTRLKSRSRCCNQFGNDSAKIHAPIDCSGADEIVQAPDYSCRTHVHAVDFGSGRLFLEGMNWPIFFA
jgi:hypothetical protein